MDICTYFVGGVKCKLPAIISCWKCGAGLCGKHAHPEHITAVYWVFFTRLIEVRYHCDNCCPSRY